MTQKQLRLVLTREEWSALKACVHGELDNADDILDDYMRALGQVAGKLDKLRVKVVTEETGEGASG